MTKQAVSQLLLLGLTLLLPACAGVVYPPAYAAEAIEGWVIDAETKQPLEGVVVTADWELRGGATPGGSTAVGELMVMESVTDKNGHFYFSPWGPIRQLKGELHNHDPRLILFKSGYVPLILSNEIRLDAKAALESVRRSRWNGKTIELTRFRGTVKQYADRIDSMMIAIRFVEDDCNWKRTPDMILELDRQEKIFRQSGIIRGVYSTRYLPTNESRCGSPKTFFESYRR